jgi:nicotinamidase-related amidase
MFLEVRCQRRCLQRGMRASLAGLLANDLLVSQGSATATSRCTTGDRIRLDGMAARQLAAPMPKCFDHRDQAVGASSDSDVNVRHAWHGSCLGLLTAIRPCDHSDVIFIDANPYPFEFNAARCALLIIDMQRDFLEPGGFGEMLGNDVSMLRETIQPNRRLLQASRQAGLFVIHTREGHRPDLSDLPPSKRRRGNTRTRIGDRGPLGRILIRGEQGHDIIPELYPVAGEPVIDKPGKGAFWSTDLHAILQHRGITQLIVTGVTTEVCVNTTVREANDRGYDCLVLADCVASYRAEFHKVGLEMITAQGGIFGWVSESSRLMDALALMGEHRS